jgi:ketosteroid isomerase-like protein
MGAERRRALLCEHCPMDHAEAQAFAQQWVKDWNAHDVEALLEHFADDVVFTSPVAIRVLGGDGVIRGKDALRKYWSEGIRLIPDLHFEGALVKEGHGTYLAEETRHER